MKPPKKRSVSSKIKHRRKANSKLGWGQTNKNIGTIRKIESCQQIRTIKQQFKNITS